MGKTVKSLTKTAGLLVGGAAVASLSAYVTTRCLMDVALNRKPPKVMQKADRLIAGSKVDREFLDALQAASERLAAQENETVEIIGHDGEPLVGHWIPCARPQRIIVAVHGWRSSWHRDFGMVSDFWQEHGCSVLYIEQRGQNNSGGQYMGFGLTERYDCVDWLRWVQEHCDPALPVYLAGVSMGATTVLMASGLELPGNVRGIMADCGFTSPGAIWKHVAEKNLHLAYGPIGLMADAICKQKLQCGAEDYSTTDALRETSYPVLLVHGTADRFVPVEMTYENYLACRSEKELLIVPGAGHGMSYFTEPQKYGAVALRFWAQHDAPPADGAAAAPSAR